MFLQVKHVPWLALAMTRTRSLACMLLLSLSVALGACAQLQPRADLPMELATPTSSTTPLDRTFAAAEASHPGESGFRLLVEGTEAFVARMQSARMAERSIDVQTYIWHADLTGKFLAWQLLESADRGVRVRLLVDDMDARAKSEHFAALSAHPNIEVRVFNPFASRDGTLSLVSEGARNFKRINRRMHNKSWIADNRFAIVGGRNLGDEYFGASDEVNFVDLDFGMVGPVVRDASASFDRYWNSPSAYPLELLAHRRHRSESAGEAAPLPRQRMRSKRRTAAMRKRCATTPPFSASHPARCPWSGRASTNSSPTIRSRSRWKSATRDARP